MIASAWRTSLEFAIKESVEYVTIEPLISAITSMQSLFVEPVLELKQPVIFFIFIIHFISTFKLELKYGKKRETN